MLRDTTMNIKLIHTQKVLSPTQISLADYTINPYRGCEFGCLYCYSRENKNIKSNGFFKCLGVKINAPDILEHELRYKKPKRVLLGSTTECFQYQELKYNVTEKILKILNNFDIPYTILTKSHLIVNYLPIIRQNRENKIYFTLNCSSNKIIKIFENKSPLVKERVKTLNEIINKNIELRVHIGPFIPYISILADIFSIIPRKINEIDVELYHQKMGNFKEITPMIEKHFGKDLKEKINKIYNNKESYFNFANELKNDIQNLNKKYQFKIFYIVPDFNEFYSPYLNYGKHFF